MGEEVGTMQFQSSRGENKNFDEKGKEKKMRERKKEKEIKKKYVCMKKREKMSMCKIK
jgi:hypothetical protein